MKSQPGVSLAPWQRWHHRGLPCGHLQPPAPGRRNLGRNLGLLLNIPEASVKKMVDVEAANFFPLSETLIHNLFDPALQANSRFQGSRGLAISTAHHWPRDWTPTVTVSRMGLWPPRCCGNFRLDPWPTIRFFPKRVTLHSSFKSQESQGSFHGITCYSWFFLGFFRWCWDISYGFVWKCWVYSQL